MYSIQVVHYFFNYPNKTKLLFVSFGKAIERGTILYAFLFLQFWLTGQSALSQDFYATNLNDNLKWFIPVALIYGVIREISFDYKATK
jgi:hypothetical protein